MNNKIHFEKLKPQHLPIIFEWLNEPHMQEFWDNSQEHKDDIINFVNGRVKQSNYFDGIYTYWIGFIEGVPYSFLLTSEVIADEKCLQIWKDNLSKTGKTYSIDFCIGNIKYLGKGLADTTLSAFTDFFHSEVDQNADTFFIDPASNNPRAMHVYSKAGFNLVGVYTADEAYWEFGSEKSYLMVKHMPSK